ncbi:MAG: hypothetical protein Q7N50_05125 [Armatimonadota bacterium]|nr:hypothetical protein [Armatimonadota bacterium]
MSNKGRDTFAVKALFVGTVAVVALAIIVAVWSSSFNTSPKVKVPTPKMPSPNAYDNYTAAAYMLNQEQDIKNAYDALIRAPGSGQQVYPVPANKILVADNASALMELRRGFNHDYWNPPLRSFSTLLPQYSKFRALARLLALEGRTKADKGDWKGAMDSYLDAMRMGRDIPRGGSLLAICLGISIQRIGRREACRAADHLTGDEAKEAAKRMEDITARRIAFADMLREEKWYMQSSLVEMFQRPRWREEFSPAHSGGGLQVKMKRLHSNLLGLTYNKSRIMSSYTDYMDSAIAASNTPYARFSEPPRPKDNIADIMACFCKNYLFVAVKTETQNALLTVTLALRAYHSDHGRYPNSLSELAPVYIKKIPNDQFALNSPLRYKRVGGKYTLYSVGPDGKDNGGKAINDPKGNAILRGLPKAERRYSVQMKSKGDIVAGVNNN